MSFTLSPEAERDIEDLLFHSLLRFGPAQAQKYRDGLTRTFRKIETYPEIAPIRLDFTPQPYRVSVYRAHVIIYASAGDSVTILRVLDSRRDWPGVFD